MIAMSEYTLRRKQIMQMIGSNNILILPSNPIAKRNGDYDYPYRQHSDFYYLTGFDEPEAVAILAPGRSEGEFILFNRKKDRAREIWDGARHGQEGAKGVFLADQAFPIDDLEKMLPSLLQDRKDIYFPLGVDTDFDKKLLDATQEARAKIRSGIQSPLSFTDLTTNLHEMRLIKSPAEIELMRKAAQISAQAHARAMQYCKPGMYEYELEAEILHEFNRHGARSPAYSSIVGSGAAACTLHYTNNNQIIQNGDLVLIDAGAEFNYYAADITRTFPANGKFTAEQAEVYAIVLTAQLAGIDTIKSGASWPDAQTAIVHILTQGLLDLGILKGSLDNLIEQQAYAPFYMHKSGHWLGLDVHDAGRYKIKDSWRVLEAGMVLTVEPGLYISAHIPNVPERWHNIGIRIEDDILVTNTGNEVLSHAAPKTISAIENLMMKS